MRDFETLKDLGSGHPTAADVIALYRKAFDRFAIRALWNVRRLEDLTMTRGLAVQGNRLNGHDVWRITVSR